ncbi:RNA-directed DNA polymerase, eukaryota [Tanacetum coccineum]
MTGDFNEVRYAEERYGSVFNQAGARAFNHFIMSSGLVDVKMEGYSFTWSLSSVAKMSRLDRFLVSEGIIAAFPSSMILCLERNLSDAKFVSDLCLKRYWSFIGPDLCSAVECFFINGFLPRGCNASFIALIPKVSDAKFVSDFRRISLIGSVYKVITKILANRLTDVISDLVSDSQTDFVANRNILDGPFILNEILTWCKRKHKQALIFKVDFAKAYDSVRWDYLLGVLKAFGFGPNWCKWIWGIFSSSMASILVNGSPTP